MRDLHHGDVDVLNACRAFVAVADLGSFTRGAADVGTSQSVVSRRIASLERHVGDVLLVRDTPRTVLTPTGAQLLPSARALVAQADQFEAAVAGRGPAAASVAVPEVLDPRDLAAAHVAAHDHGMSLRLLPLPPAPRRDAAATGELDAALVTREPHAADFRVPLGIAAALPSPRRVRLEHLRPRRGAAQIPTVWLTAEDAVPHVHDRLTAAAERYGLLPTQVQVAATVPEAVAAALTSSDVVIMSPREAHRHDLAWTALEPGIARGYSIDVTSRRPPDIAEVLTACLHKLIETTTDVAAP
jgi:DNA-binding transcriptional LysR family regulator